MHTILEHGNDARLGEADTENSGLEFEGDGSLLFGVIPDDDLCTSQTGSGPLLR